MEKAVKIIIDTKGGDRGADAAVKGAAAALEKFPTLAVALAGDEDTLKSSAQALGMPQDRVEYIDAKGEITNFDTAADALFHKQDASMIKALEALSAREDLFGMITCGNTAVLISGALRYLSGENRVRPALAAVLPAETGAFVCLVDTGATVDCTPQMLLHFARLGSDFMKKSYGIADPRVGLLSNGAEPTKGNKLVKEAHALMDACEDINFTGNVEGCDALSGSCDVLVCDGFAGNQVLKVTEGTAKRIITDIMKYAHKTGSRDAHALGSHLLGVYDIGSLGGGIVLGVEKHVIKARGSADEKTFVSTAEMLINAAANKEIFDKSRNTIN